MFDQSQNRQRTLYGFGDTFGKGMLLGMASPFFAFGAKIPKSFLPVDAEAILRAERAQLKAEIQKFADETFPLPEQRK